MKKIVLAEVPEKNIEGGIRIATGETSYTLMDIVVGQTEYLLPDRNIMEVLIYTKIIPEEV